MAGINIIFNSNKGYFQKQKFHQIQSSLNLVNNYSEVIDHDTNIFLGWNKFIDYPIIYTESEDFMLIIEGRIYNKSELRIREELERIFSSFENSLLNNWLLESDGDFIIYLFNKKTKISYIFNDILGRLPLYFSATNEGFVITRQIRFVTKISGDRTFDPIALGEYLILGYLLGERTLFKNIRQLRPASLIIVNNNNVEIKKLNEFNFEICLNEGKSFNENVDNLSNLFSAACKNRFDNHKLNLLALSSGLDSRTVAVCLSKNKIPYDSLTMVYENGHGREEVEVAKYIANFLNVKWRSLLIPPPTGKHMLSLLEAKEGMNFLATAPMLPFYEILRDLYDTNFNFITGDKSDKIALLYDVPVPKLSSVEDLINHILTEHAMIDLPETCKIVGINKEDILEDFSKLLMSYPEQDYSKKYIHFRAIEKSHKLAFHGDDRHKRYLWSYSPLASSPFVIYAFNCPQNIKKMHKLFIALMDSYNSSISKILYTNFKAPVTSLRGKLFMWSAFYIYPMLSAQMNNYIKNVFFTGNPYISEDSIFYKCMEQQLDKTPEIREYLRIPEISYLKKFRMHMMSTFFTLTSVIEFFYADKSTFLQFQNTNFDYRH